MAHVKPHHLGPQDFVIVWDHGPPEEPFALPVQIRMHATEANEAIDRDPARFAMEQGQTIGPIKPKRARKSKEASEAGDVQTGANGPLWYPGANDGE